MLSLGSLHIALSPHYSINCLGLIALEDCDAALPALFLITHTTLDRRPRARSLTCPLRYSSLILPGSATV